MIKLRKSGPERLEGFAYENRRDLTRGEEAMAAILAELGWRFNIEHPKHRQNIIVDFLVPAFRLVIEVDGGYHATRKDRDRERDKALVRRGLLVQRFTNDQVINFPKRTRATLLKRISAPIPDKTPVRLPSVRRVRDVFIPSQASVVHEQ